MSSKLNLNFDKQCQKFSILQKTSDASQKLMASKNDAQVAKITVPVLTNTLHSLIVKIKEENFKILNQDCLLDSQMLKTIFI